MPPARLTGAASWLTDPPAAALFAALSAAGGTARAVGGCVRDTLLGRPVGDIDMAVDLSPDAVIAALEAAEIRAIPTGIEHGTVTALPHGQPIEVTSLREDVETDGRRAVVAFTTNWEADSLRRDFTMNALYADPDGTLYDFHDGRADLADGRLRFIGDADQRIREDVLRILRFFRFHAQLDLAPFDAEGLAACAARRDLLPQLSAERVAKELLKLLVAPDPTAVVRAMAEGGFLEHWLPEARDIVSLGRTEPNEDPIRRLAVLCPQGTGAVAKRLKLSNADSARLLAIAEYRAPPPDAAAARRLIYTKGKSIALDLAAVGLARGAEGWRIIPEEAARWDAPVFPIGGKEALECGLSPGPELGAALARAERAWIESDFALDRAALIAKLKG